MNNKNYKFAPGKFRGVEGIVDFIEDNFCSVSVTGFKAPGEDIKGQETKLLLIQFHFNKKL